MIPSHPASASSHFDSKKFNKYLDKSGAASTWSTLEAELSRGVTPEKALRTHLPAMKLGELLQFEDTKPQAAELEERAQLVRSKLEETSMSTRQFRDAAQAIFSAVQTLEEYYSLGNPALWEFNETAVEESLNREITQFATSLAKDMSVQKVISLRALVHRLQFKNLPESTYTQAVKELADRKIAVVDDFNRRLLADIQSTFSFGIMELLFPTAFAQGKTPGYSVFNAALRGKKPVTTADVNAAIDYYTQVPNRKEKKNLAAKLLQVYPNNAKLRQAVLAYHLAIWDEIHEGRSRTEIKEHFRQMGVHPSEIRRLAGEVEAPQAPKPKPVESPAVRQDIDRHEFSKAIQLYENKYLFAAQQEIARLERNGVEAKSNVVPDLKAHLRIGINNLDTDLHKARNLVQNNRVEEAYDVVLGIYKYCQDSPDAHQLVDQITEIGKNPTFIDNQFIAQFAPVGKEGLVPGFLHLLPRGIAKNWLAFLILFVPATLFDGLIVAASDSYSGGMSIISRIVAAVGLVAVSWLVDKKVIRYILLIILLFWLLNMGLGALIAGIIFWLSIPRIDANKEAKARAEAWNASLANARQSVLESGYMADTAGLYLGNRRSFPPRTTHALNNATGMTVLAESGDVLNEMPIDDLRAMAQSGQLINANKWIADALR